MGAHGYVAAFFAIMARHSGAPPPPSSPLAWGDPSQLEKLLGKAFDLKFEKGVSNAYCASAEDIWDAYTCGFGPLRHLAETLPDDRVEQLKRDVDAFHRQYMVPAGLHVKREYLITIGRRRHGVRLVRRLLRMAQSAALAPGVERTGGDLRPQLGV